MLQCTVWVVFVIRLIVRIIFSVVHLIMSRNMLLKFIQVIKSNRPKITASHPPKVYVFIYLCGLTLENSNVGRKTPKTKISLKEQFSNHPSSGSLGRC